MADAPSRGHHDNQQPQRGGAPLNGSSVSTLIYDITNADEMQVLSIRCLGRSRDGGPQQVNLVPESGGNAFKGSAFL